MTFNPIISLIIHYNNVYYAQRWRFSVSVWGCVHTWKAGNSNKNTLPTSRGCAVERSDEYQGVLVQSTRRHRIHPCYHGGIRLSYPLSCSLRRRNSLANINKFWIALQEYKNSCLETCVVVCSVLRSVLRLSFFTHNAACVWLGRWCMVHELVSRRFSSAF